MIFNEKGIPHIECETCFNNDNSVCPCVIFSGNTNLPNLFNKEFPPIIKNYKVKSKPKENIYEVNLL